jgi:hypothetical protein
MKVIPTSPQWHDISGESLLRRSLGAAVFVAELTGRIVG